MPRASASPHPCLCNPASWAGAEPILRILETRHQGGGAYSSTDAHSGPDWRGRQPSPPPKRRPGSLLEHLQRPFYKAPNTSRRVTLARRLGSASAQNGADAGPHPSRGAT